ncbi:MAG: glycosyltransferase family 4 protein [Synechococcales cyanobacterium RM1_1_8]|nr:glycosyltransferase family 4 protein [Synechococcales cyanobacterium RM1_1_8]
MKILVVSHTYIVDLNCEKLRELAKLHCKNGEPVEVAVVVPQRWRPGGVQNKIIEPEAKTEGNFRLVPLPSLSENNQGLLSFGWGLVTFLQDFRPDVIQVEQGSKSIAYAQLITLNKLLGLKAKLLFFTWWNLPYQLKFPFSMLEAYNLKNTDGVVVGNKDGGEVLRDRNYNNPMRILPQLGIDERIFKPQQQPALMQQYGIETSDFIVGFVGRFVPEKGLMTLAKALAGLKEQNWKWLILGRGPLEPELKQWAKEEGLEDRLILIESVPHADVPRYINLMSTLLLPSETTYDFKTLTAAGWKEQFGHVIIEAMASAVPVIGSDSGEIPNVIGTAGLVFPEGNVAELQERLHSLMTQPGLAKKLGQRGYEKAMERYTNRALAEEQLGFYEELLAEGVAATLGGERQEYERQEDERQEDERQEDERQEDERRFVPT